jgi:hypothetical protein
MRACPPERLKFFECAANHLEDVVGDVRSKVEGLALMGILYLQRIQFADGVVLNGDTDEENLLGRSEAAILVSCLCSNPDQDWLWWRSEESFAGKDLVDEYRKRYESLSARIAAHPTVAAVS